MSEEIKTTQQENYFKALYDIDMTDKVKQKNGLKYISWAAAWAELKKHHPDAEVHVYEWTDDTTTITEYVDSDGNTTSRETKLSTTEPRPWFIAGNTAYVKVGVTVNGIEYADPYPIMDHRNNPIPADKVTITDANKAKMRALAKMCAFHGIGLYIYQGEDLPDGVKQERTNLAAMRKKVVSAAQTAVNKRGVNRDAIYKLIGEKNGGVEDPNQIASAKICEELISAIAAMKGTAKK